ncbi:MAG TPA: hypothetical protein VER11_28495 [Polyangiaceae bacterium]|nr:hypothetical protein [Polyangiaceae bacterium]
MSSGFKLIVPSALAFYLAAACAPDLDSLSASYSATSLGGSSNGGSDSEAGSGNGSSGGSTPTDPCSNGKKDTKESDVDCGGTSTCDRCIENSKCTSNNDCESKFCKSGRCTEPRCDDKIQNQDETGVDCGGTCLPCDIGVSCGSNDDCDGHYCLDGKCADHCVSGVLEAQTDETDVDCGGETCDKCADTKKCVAATDCTSAICSNQKCQKPTCSDQVKNQDESDTDCGGACSATKPCGVNATCNGPSDCASWICSGTTGKCLADTVVVADGDMIDDFEDGDLFPLALDGRVGNWYAYGDGSGITTADVVTMNRGKGKMVLHHKGKDFTNWGSGVGVDLAHGSGDKLSYDASAFNSVTFWGRATLTGTDTLNVTVALPTADTDGLVKNKTCTTCDHHYFKNVTFTSTWQRFVVRFDDLSLEPGGKPEPVPAFNAGVLSSVQMRVVPGLTYELYIDDLAFVKP